MKTVIELVLDALQVSHAVISLSNNVPYEGMSPKPIALYGDASDPPAKMIETIARH